MHNDTLSVAQTSAKAVDKNNLRPQILPHFRVEVVESQSVYLLAEHDSHVLSGGLYCTLVPLLDGSRTLETLYEEVGPEIPAEHVDYVLGRLKERGYLIDQPSTLDEGAAAYWSAQGLAPQTVPSHLAQWEVLVKTVGEVNAEPVVSAFQEMGLPVQLANTATPSEKAPFWVVLADDFLQPSLRAINQEAIASQTPWVLIKPVGSVLWMSPVFKPGETACWSCLAHRLRGHEKIRISVLQQQLMQARAKGQSTQGIGLLPLSKASLSLTQVAGIGIMAPSLTRWLIMEALIRQGEKINIPNSPYGALTTLDTRTMETEHHPVTKRPQCPDCGNPSLKTERARQPLTLQPCKKSFTRDGGHRAISPEATVAKYQHLISPLTGVVASLKRIATSNQSLVHNYAAPHAYHHGMETLGGLKNALGVKSGGKGKTDAQSRASGLCEGLERYSGFFQGDEPRVKATMAQLGDQVVDLQGLLLYSDQQYADRETINKTATGANSIPLRLPPDQEIEWTPVWSLTEQRHKYIPTSYAYYGYPRPQGMYFAGAHSNGNAAGNTPEEAILQGFFEIVERDAVAIWWYNRLTYPGVDLASFEEPYFAQLKEFYAANNRDLWVLDVTTDFDEVPVFIALSRRNDGGAERTIVGFGAHTEAKIAVERALTEMNQIGLAYDTMNLEDPKKSAHVNDYTRQWLLHATVAEHPYLAPNPNQPLKTPADYPTLQRDDIREDIMACVEKAKTLGMETLVLDQTQPDIGLNVVKVIVPYMRMHWTRFGPGRLYDVPAKMGWTQAPTTEKTIQLQPMPWA